MACDLLPHGACRLDPQGLCSGPAVLPALLPGALLGPGHRLQGGARHQGPQVATLPLLKAGPQGPRLVLAAASPSLAAALLSLPYQVGLRLLEFVILCWLIF